MAIVLTWSNSWIPFFKASIFRFLSNLGGFGISNFSDSWICGLPSCSRFCFSFLGWVKDLSSGFKFGNSKLEMFKSLSEGPNSSLNYFFGSLQRGFFCFRFAFLSFVPCSTIFSFDISEIVLRPPDIWESYFVLCEEWELDCKDFLFNSLCFSLLAFKYSGGGILSFAFDLSLTTRSSSLSDPFSKSESWQWYGSRFGIILGWLVSSIGK